MQIVLFYSLNFSLISCVTNVILCKEGMRCVHIPIVIFEWSSQGVACVTRSDWLCKRAR